jgi:hypothetical protein
MAWGGFNRHGGQAAEKTQDREAKPEIPDSRFPLSVGIGRCNVRARVLHINVRTQSASYVGPVQMEIVARNLIALRRPLPSPSDCCPKIETVRRFIPASPSRRRVGKNSPMTQIIAVKTWPERLIQRGAKKFFREQPL